MVRGELIAMAANGFLRLQLAPRLTMSMQTQMDIAGLIILLTPVGLIYSWHFYFTQIRREAAGWRNRITLLSLALVSVAVLLLPLLAVLSPRADYHSYVGVQQQLGFIASWQKPTVRILLAAFFLCFLGRPRLIGPIAVACVGTTLFWLSLTMT
jgi:hypothetical protein